MKTELHYYDIFPKVVVSGRETLITIKPLGWHAAFPKACTLSICPLDEGKPADFPDRPNLFVYDVTPDDDGCIRFTFRFFGEQAFFVRVTDEQNNKLQLSVFAVDGDLVGRYPFRGDLHLHTKPGGGAEAPEIVCANYRKTGYDFLAITEHHRFYPSMDAIAAFQNVPIEMTILTGEEVHLPSDAASGHVNDIHIVHVGGLYSVNGLVEQPLLPADEGKPRSTIPNPPPMMTAEAYWATIDEYAKGLDIPEGVETYTYAACHWIYNEIRKAGGLGILVHPYWISNVFHMPPSFVEYMMETQPFDAFEVLGGELYYEQNGFQALQYYEDRAKGRRYPVVGSTDSHRSVNNPGSHVASTIVFAHSNDREDLLSSIRGQYTVAVDSISTEPRYVGELRLVRYACFLEKEFFPLHDDLCYEEGRAMKDYICGEAGALEELSMLHGRMKAQREKYFAF